MELATIWSHCDRTVYTGCEEQVAEQEAPCAAQKHRGYSIIACAVWSSLQ